MKANVKNRFRRIYRYKFYVLLAILTAVALNLGYGVMAEWPPTQPEIVTPCPGPGFTSGFTNAADVPVASGPRSVAIGDFNGDGMPDLATADASVAPSVANVSIRLGNGSGGFTSPSTPQISAGAFPVAVAIADLNGDGKQDLVAVNQDSNNVSIRLGNGAGGFTSPLVPEVAVRTEPIAVAVADFNGDGNPDLAVVNGGIVLGEGGTVSIRLGNGAGGFTSPSVPEVPVGVFFPISQALSIATADFNGDGRIDLAVGSGTNTSNAVSIRLGDGAGGFTSPAVAEVRFNSQVLSVAIADFNRDGRQDFAVTQDNGAGMVSIRLGDGNGGFTSPAVPNIPIPGAFLGVVAIGDFNGDGNPDFAAGTRDNVSIRLGNGAGGFTLPFVSEFAAGFYLQSIAVADLNGDGRQDLAEAINDISVTNMSRVAIRLGNCTVTPTASPTPTPTPTPTRTPTPTPTPTSAPTLYDFNATRFPNFLVWGPNVSAVGWYITPNISMNLTKIETNFNPVIQSGSQNRIVTVEILTNRRAAGGTLLRSATFDSAIARGTLGGASFAPLALTAGTTYFIGFRNVGGIGINTTNEQGATNCGACVYADTETTVEGQYQIRFGDANPSEIDQPILRLSGSPPSAQPVSISGRVTTPSGQGLRNAAVILTDPNGIRRTATTSSFGLYSFDGVATGQAYTIGVSSKRYRFSPFVGTVTTSLTDVNFVGLE